MWADASLIPLRIIGNILNFVPRRIRRASSYLGTMIEEKLSQDKRQLDDGSGVSPANLIDWLLKDAPGEHRTVHDIVLRILAVNFAAIHTSTAVRGHFPTRFIWTDVGSAHTGMHARLV